MVQSAALRARRTVTCRWLPAVAPFCASGLVELQAADRLPWGTRALQSSRKPPPPTPPYPVRLGRLVMALGRVRATASLVVLEPLSAPEMIATRAVGCGQDGVGKERGHVTIPA